MSAALALYRAMTAVGEPLAPALLRARARRGKEDPRRLDERLGRSTEPRPAGPLAWLHGASVGEAVSLLPLIAGLRAARPALNLLVTSGTVTSAELMARRLPDGVIHQYAPIDAPAAAGRFLAHWRPDLAVLVESDLWPNLVRGAQARGARLALLSARLSEQSLSGWSRAPAAARALFSAFSVVMAQDDHAAVRLARLGARDDGRLNLKLAGEPLPVDEAALAAARAAAGARPVLVAASTHEGEEVMVLEAFERLRTRPDRPLLVLVPRHPARGEAVAGLVAARGLGVRREGAGQAFDGQAEVHVADTLGELGLWLRLASAVLVGGSLVAGIGGHNPLEAARLDAPLLAGPHVDNWREVYAGLVAADAVAVAADTERLALSFAIALDDRSTTDARAARGRAFADRGASALDQALPKLLALLP